MTDIIFTDDKASQIHIVSKDFQQDKKGLS